MTPKSSRIRLTLTTTPTRRTSRSTCAPGDKVGSTDVTVTVRGLVCTDGMATPTYTAPTGTGTVGEETAWECATGTNLLDTTATHTYTLHVGYADPTVPFTIGAVNYDGVIYEAFGGSPTTVTRFGATIQDSHEGEIDLFGYDADGNLANTNSADERTELDRPIVTFNSGDFQGRVFTYKLAGARVNADNEALSDDQIARNMGLARMLTVSTEFIQLNTGNRYEPVAIINARSDAMLPVGEFSLVLTGSDDATDGKSATIPIDITVTQSNRAPTISGEFRGEPIDVTVDEDTGMQSADLEFAAISADRQVDADDDDDAFLFDFTGFFTEPDNQVLQFTLRDNPAAFLLKQDSGVNTGMLRQATAINYDDLLEAHTTANPTIHVAGVDANDDNDFADEGDTWPILKYEFSVVASDGSSEAVIDVLLPIMQGEVTAVDEGVAFEEPENNVANLLVGRVIIEQNSQPATTGFKIQDNAENPNLYVLLKDADGDPITGNWTGTDAIDRDDIASTEIVEQGTTGAVTIPTFEIVASEAAAGTGEKPGELRVPIAGAFDYEKKAQYSLTVIAGTFVDQGDRPNRNVIVTITDVNEAPVFGATFDADNDDAFTPPTTAPEYVAGVTEGADLGDVVNVHSGSLNNDGTDAMPLGDAVSAADQDRGQTATLAYSLVEDADDDADTAKTAFTGPFAIDNAGVVTVTGALDAEVKASYDLFIRVTDSGGESADAPLAITVRGVNENPYFVAPGANCEQSAKLSSLSVATQDENVGTGTVIARYKACDPDGDDIEFELRPSDDSSQFTITSIPGADGSGEATATLSVSSTANLDYETKTSYTVEVEVTDNDGGQGQLLQQLDLNNLNDNAPVWQASPDGDPNSLSVNENTLRGVTLATYVATDADGDPITYTLSGGDASQYQIDASSGVLATLASLDADRGNLSDSFTVTADDSGSTLRGSSGNATVDRKRVHQQC